MNPASLLQDVEILRGMESACRRRILNPLEAEECYDYVLHKLQEDDFRRLRRFKGRSKPSTYIYTVTNRLIMDFIRSRHGRMRVPEMVAKMGSWAIELYKIICWKRNGLDEGYELLFFRGEYSGSFEQFSLDAEPVLAAPCPERARFVSLEQRAERGTDPQPGMRAIRWSCCWQGLNAKTGARPGASSRSCGRASAKKTSCC